MKVNFATAIFCEKTALALRTAHAYGLLPDQALTTCWFIEQVCKWFKIMTSRHFRTAIGKKSMKEKHDFLKEFMTIIEEMMAADKRWKPSQKGILVSTANVIHLSETLISKNILHFFMASRLTQDALENIFSRVRFKGTVHPSPLQALRAVRLISIASLQKKYQRVTMPKIMTHTI